MIDLLSSHLEDCSTPRYFCFSIRCEVCGEFWYSSSIPFSKAAQAAEHREKKELYAAIYQREKERARLAAGQEARERFSQCPICRWSSTAAARSGWSATPASSSATRWIYAGSAPAG